MQRTDNKGANDERTAAIGIGLTLVSIAATFAGGCDKQSPADLVLTLDGQPYRSNFQNGGLNSTADPTVVDIAMCVHPSVSSLAAVDDDYCQVFQVASDLFQTLAIPATLRVLGTASTVDSQPGVPTDGNPVWTFAPETGMPRKSRLRSWNTGKTPPPGMAFRRSISTAPW